MSDAALTPDDTRLGDDTPAPDLFSKFDALIGERSIPACAIPTPSSWTR